MWREKKGSFFQPAGLLIMDLMKPHLVEPVKVAAKEVSASFAIIPAVLMKYLQPLDLSVNKSFKAKVRKQWETWMLEGIHCYTKSGKMRKATFEDSGEMGCASMKSGFCTNNSFWIYSCRNNFF